MSLAKSGQIGNVCLPNALMTLCEYSMDYGDETFRKKASAILEKETLNIVDDQTRSKTIENIEKIKSGKGRDFYV
jgi:2-iminoacetate synthase